MCIALGICTGRIHIHFIIGQLLYIFIFLFHPLNYKYKMGTCFFIVPPIGWISIERNTCGQVSTNSLVKTDRVHIKYIFILHCIKIFSRCCTQFYSSTSSTERKSYTFLVRFPHNSFTVFHFIGYPLNNQADFRSYTLNRNTSRQHQSIT